MSIFAALGSDPKRILEGTSHGFSPGEAQIIANLIPRKNPAETYTIAESDAAVASLAVRYDWNEPGARDYFLVAHGTVCPAAAFLDSSKVAANLSVAA